MDHTPSWKANTYSAQKTVAFLWNPAAYYCVLEILTLDFILREINPVHFIKIYVSKTNLVLPSYQRLSLWSDLFISRFSGKILNAFLISPMPVPGFTETILLDLIIKLCFKTFCGL